MNLPPVNLRTGLVGLTPLLLCASAWASPIYSNDFEHHQPATNGGSWSHTVRSNLGGPYTTVLGRFPSRRVSFDLRATPENTAGLNSGGGGGGEQFNLTVDRRRWDRKAMPLPDGGGGGHDDPGVGGFDPDLPRLNLGEALSSGGGATSSSGEVIFGAGTYALTFDLMLFDSWDGGHEGYGPDSFAVEINGQRLFDELLESQWLPNNFRMPDEIPDLNVYGQNWQDQIYRDIRLEFELTQASDLMRFAFIGTLNQAIGDESWGIDNVRVDQIAVARSASSPVPAPGTLAMLVAGLGLGAWRRR